MLHLQYFIFPSNFSVYPHQEFEFGEPTDPLGAFETADTKHFRSVMLSPLCLAVAKGEIEVVCFLLQHYKMQTRMDLDVALFLANRLVQSDIAAVLLEYGARPGTISSQAGIHGAAWSGLNETIMEYVEDYNVDPDLRDRSDATPIIYAMFGRQDEMGAWETIKHLFESGATLDLFLTEEKLSYFDIARRTGKAFLAQKFQEMFDKMSEDLTIENSSRESSCTLGGEDNFQHYNEQEDSEGGEAANSGCRSSRTL
ncbi:hypothetical protein ACHAQC_004025 [Fusarium culmorum]